MLHWFRRRSRSSRRSHPRRGRPRLYLEPLETRALLSAASLINPLVLLANPVSSSALVATPVSAVHQATSADSAATTQNAALLSRAPTLGSGATSSIHSDAQVTAKANTSSTQTVQLVPQVQVTPVVNLVEIGNVVFADLSLSVSLTFVPSQTTSDTGTSTTQNTGTPLTTIAPSTETVTVSQPSIVQQVTTVPSLPTATTTVPNTAPSTTTTTIAPQSTTTSLSAVPSAANLGNASTAVLSPTSTASAVQFVLFAQQPRTSAVIVPVVLNVSTTDGESLLLASPLSPLPSNAGRQNVPTAAALNAVPGPTGSLLFGLDGGAPILQRVVNGVGGDVEGAPPVPSEEAPPVMPWNAAALPAATAPLGHTPAALTVLDAIDEVLAGDASATVRGEEQVVENNQGVRTALAPAMALAGLTLVLGGCWAPAANAYDREERKLPKGH